MNIRFLVASLIALQFSLYAPSTLALTMKQVSVICHSSPVECSDHPIIQAYVGGALDLLATLDEHTDYLEKSTARSLRSYLMCRLLFALWSNKVSNTLLTMQCWY